jgi:hypothetical protein
MPQDLRQILSQQRLDGPGIVNAYAKRVRVIQHLQDLWCAHLPARPPPVLAKAAAKIAAGIYAVGEHKGPLSNPHLPDSSGGHARRKRSHEFFLNKLL